MEKRDELNQAITEIFIDQDPMGAHSNQVEDNPNLEPLGRGNAGPGYTGVIALGPYAFPNEEDDQNPLSQTIGELREKGVEDPYGTIEQE